MEEKRRKIVLVVLVLALMMSATRCRDVTNIIEECVDAYRTMLEEDWLSDETY